MALTPIIKNTTSTVAIKVQPEIFLATSLKTNPTTVATQKWLYVEKMIIAKSLFLAIKTQTYPVVYSNPETIYGDNKNQNLFWYLPEFVIDENSLLFESELDLLPSGEPKINANQEQLYKAKITVAIQKQIPPAVSQRMLEIKKQNQQAAFNDIPMVGGAISAKLRTTIYNNDGSTTPRELYPGLKAITGTRYEFVFEVPFEGLKILYSSLKSSAESNSFVISGSYMVLERPFVKAKLPDTAWTKILAFNKVEKPSTPILIKTAPKPVVAGKETGNVKVKLFNQTVKNFSFPCAQHPSSYKVKNPATGLFAAVGCNIPWSNKTDKFSDLFQENEIANKLLDLGIKDVYSSTIVNKQFTIVPKEYNLAWVIYGDDLDSTKETAGAFIDVISDVANNNSVLQMNFIVAPAISAAQMHQIQQRIFSHLKSKQVKVDSAEEINIKFPDTLSESNSNYTFIPENIDGTTSIVSGGSYLFGPGESFKVSLSVLNSPTVALLINSIKNVGFGITSNVSFKLNEFVNVSSIFSIRLNKLAGDILNYTPEIPAQDITIENTSGLNLMVDSIQLSKSATEYFDLKVTRPLEIGKKISIAGLPFQPARWNAVTTVTDNAELIIKEQISDVAQEAQENITFLISDPDWFSQQNVSSVELIYELAQANLGSKSLTLTSAVSQKLVQINLPLIKYVFDRMLNLVIKVNFSNGKPQKVMNALLLDLQVSSFINIDSKITF